MFITLIEIKLGYPQLRIIFIWTRRNADCRRGVIVKKEDWRPFSVIKETKKCIYLIKS